MCPKPATRHEAGLKPWQIVLLFGVLQSGVFALAIFFFDYYAGAATVGFGVMGPVPGVGMFWVYMIGYFNALVVILPILLVRRFGVGAAVYLPYAISGLFVEYYFEWVVTRVLVSPWAVVGWCVLGVAVGFSADLAYRFLPAALGERWRATLTGVVMGAASFLTTLAAVRFFYVGFDAAAFAAPGTFLGLAYFCLPWLLVNSGLGGYTAYALARRA